VPRFIELPPIGQTRYYMFVEDAIAANMAEVFDCDAADGYEIEGTYNVKISRDADIFVDDNSATEAIADTIREKVKKRKIGDLSRFVYDRRMPDDSLRTLCDIFRIGNDDMIPDFVHLNMEDLRKLPNPFAPSLETPPDTPIRIAELDRADWLFPAIRRRDVFFQYPYHAFDYLVRFLAEAAVSPQVDEIMITQYRVAEDSEIISNLINAAKNGKKVTVFVELKARFDEENNLYTSEMMKNAGINIIYSIPGLKVHAKVALVAGHSRTRRRRCYAYISTGNFNEKTARLYSDMAILTANKTLTGEIIRLFTMLETRNRATRFDRIWVAQFNMVENLTDAIRRETAAARAGRKAHIILKMNGLQDCAMIDELYAASEAGVQIDLLVRGICCLKPEQPCSRNIRIIRLVDRYLEHARIWYFHADGRENLYLSSADWMKRNLYRRIETAFPVLDRDVKRRIIDILNIYLADNVKACLIDKNMQNIPLASLENPDRQAIRAQDEIYRLLKTESTK